VDWFITHGWVEHSQRLNGLFDAEFTPCISAVLDIDQKELAQISEIGRDIKAVGRYALHQPDEDAFRLLKEAFVVSALIRGRYHESVARRSDWQIIHHPIRQPVLPSAMGKPAVEFPVNTLQYLSNIILASAFAEKGHDARLACWTENVRKARSPALAGEIDLQAKGTDQVALDLAVRDAKRIGIRTHPSQIEQAFDAGAALGVGVLTSFYLVGWQSFAVAGGTYLASRSKDIGARVMSGLYSRKSRLRDLAELEPGRVEARWRRT
jgi:hypothetical protein